jgi:hypothetical protein
MQTAKETSAFMFVYSVMDRSCFEFGMVPLLRVVVHRATTPLTTALVLSCLKQSIGPTGP